MGREIFKKKREVILAIIEEEIRQKNEERCAKLDAVSCRNMEKCAVFIAQMVEKYGREVLTEIEEEKWQAAANKKKDR